MHSRYAFPFVVRSLSGPELIEGLLLLQKQLEATPLLFLTSDPQVQTISEHREHLAGKFQIRLPERDCIRQLMHKLSFQRIAESHGFPVPRTVGISCEKNLEELANIRFPAVLKPGNKGLYFANKSPRAQKVSTYEEAVSACRAILGQAPDLIVQEWVRGRESDIYFCLQYRGENGFTVSSFVGRKLRSWPPQTGSTASCTAAPEVAPLLTRLTKEFFNETQLAGMCSMEFKLDQETGNFFMIEPTVGRTDWQEEIASINGVNIPLSAYCYEAGLPLPAEEVIQPSQIWVHPQSYFRSVVSSMLAAGSWRDRRMTVGISRLAPYWHFDDPMPHVFAGLEWIRKVWNPARWHEVVSQPRVAYAAPGNLASPVSQTLSSAPIITAPVVENDVLSTSTPHEILPRSLGIKHGADRPIPSRSARP